MNVTGRRLKFVALALLAAPFLPLPSSCDPRLEELPAERYGELSRFAGTRTRADIEADLRLIDPQRALDPYLRWTDTTLEIRLAPGDRAPVVRIPLRTTAAAAGDEAAVLPGPHRRIAVDPGHWGGAWSAAEKRQFRREGGPLLREGDLSWATARLVERDLRGLGQDVRLLRGPPPQAPFTRAVDPSFDPDRERRVWMAMHAVAYPRWLSPLAVWQLRRQGERFARESAHDLYTQHELRRRAAVAEAFAPDVTLSLHYNFTLQDRNGVLVFLAGNFLPHELVTRSQRFWALRHVLDGSLEHSRRLASAMGRALMQQFDLPALGAEGPAWLPVDPQHGVFARNLAILRRTPGVSLVLEGPCLNQTDEYPRMSGQDIEVDGRRYPMRIRQYADAVLAGLQAR